VPKGADERGGLSRHFPPGIRAVQGPGLQHLLPHHRQLHGCPRRLPRGFQPGLPALEGFRLESKFSSWIYRIAVNASIDLRRRANSRRSNSLDTLRSNPDADRPQFEDSRHEQPTAAATRHELESEVQDAILRLSPKLRSVIVLRYIEGMAYDRIAETLDISLGTVKSRLSRAHAAMDRELSPLIDRHFMV